MNVFSMEQLGLTEAQREAAGELTQLGRVAAQYRDGYTVLTATGERSAVVAGRLRHESTRPADFPAVGDFVALERAQQSCNLLTGESPVQVTTKGPGSYKTSVNRDGDVEASRKSVNEV